MPEPITREETYLAAAAGESVTLPTPVTREELFLAKLAGEDVETPTPVTRKEMFLEAAAQGGGGGGVTVEPLSVTANGVYNAPTGKAYSPVTVAVPLNVGITESTSSMNSRFQNAVFSPAVNKLTLHNTNSSSVSATNFCNGITGVSELDITVDNGISNLSYAFNNCKAPHITIHANTSGCTNFSTAFGGNATETFLITVDGDALDLSSATSLGDLIGKRVKEIRFVPNSAKISWQMNSSQNVSDDTLISIANALDGTAADKTLKIHATPKARCQTLMGTVADGLFTADASGTVTLADFITNTKGWTLA